ncbi:MAG: hypothetical protein HY241_02140 [Actinobacteria bacterium]|nr:hypothetical protein [Actinomycetota bacterium]
MDRYAGAAAGRPRTGDRRRRPSTVWSAFVAATSSAFAGFAVVAALVLVGWGLSSPDASAADALRLAAQGWLLAHRARLDLVAGEVGLVPLGLTALVAGLLYRAGSGLGRALRVAELGTAARAVVALSGCYAAVVVITTGLADTPTVRVDPARTLLGAGAIAVISGGLGLLRGSPLGARLLTELPDGARLAGRFAAVSTAIVIAAGAVLAGGSLAFHHRRAAELSHALAPGLVDGIGLTLLGLVLVPNAAVWGAAYAVGPGFAVGAGTSVTPLSATAGPVPAFPLLAAVPAGGLPPLLVVAVLAVPVLAAVLGGIAVGRVRGPTGRAIRSVLAGSLLAGLGLAVLAWLAGGPLGFGRLAVFGPVFWRVGLAAAAELAVVGVNAAGITRWWLERRALR